MEITSWFTESICNAFGYLESDYGFKIIVFSGEHVQFYSDLISLRFTYEQYSGYIAVIFSHLDGTEEMGLREFAGALGKQMKHYETGLYAYDHHVARKCIFTLSKDIKKNMGMLLFGDEEFYSFLLQEANRQRVEELDQDSYGALRSRSNDAWEQKDFEELVFLYNKIGDENLTNGEKRRKSYALKKLN